MLRELRDGPHRQWAVRFRQSHASEEQGSEWMAGDGPATIIDITFDFRSDTRPGLDPDTHSLTLRTYHQLLWSKALPSGAQFALDVGASPPYYLRHRSELGGFRLSSDTVVPTYS